MKSSPQFRSVLKASGFPTQQELARAACIDPPILSMIVSGRMRPTPQERKRLRGFLGVDIVRLVPLDADILELSPKGTNDAEETAA